MLSPQEFSKKVGILGLDSVLTFGKYKNTILKEAITEDQDYFLFLDNIEIIFEDEVYDYFWGIYDPNKQLKP